MIDRQPPRDIAAEQAVLGSVLIDPSCMDQIVGILQSADFWDHAMRIAFNVCCDIHEAGKPVDVRLIASELKRRKQFDAIGGSAMLAKCAEAVPHALNATYYARIVKAKSDLRRIIEEGTKAISEAYDEADTAEMISNRLSARLDSVQGSESDLVPISQCVQAVRQRKNQGERFGVPTGIVELDEATGGLKPTQLTVLAAGTSIGKTALAAQIARHAAERSRAILFVTLEVNGQELVEDKLLKHRNGSCEERLSDIERLPITICERGRLEVSRISGLAKLLQSRSALDLIIVDYLQLLDGTGKTRYEQVSDVSRQLKAIAMDLQLPVLALSQFNRDFAKANRKPELYDLRESGTIEQDANNVWLLHRPSRMKSEADLYIAKHRGGELARVPLSMDLKRQLFFYRHEHSNDFAEWAK